MLMVLALALPGRALAALQAQTDRNPVGMDESFNLILQSDSGGDDPDLSGLKRDFDVRGQSKSSNIQIINGRVSRSAEWRIALMAKHSGQILIPAIRAGNQSSQPIALNVTAAAKAPASQTRGDLFVEVSATPRTAYVQQQILFTVRLYRAVNLGNDSTMSDPEFPKMDAIVKKLGDDREFRTIRNAQEYVVTERRYAIFPQQSGSFNSDPVVFEGEIEEGGGGMFGFDPFRQNSRHVRVRSSTLAFTVKPVPAGVNRNQWLPVSLLQLHETWSDNPPVFTVGEPITRTLQISARGLTAVQLPALGGEAIDGVKLYPDQPVLKDTPDDSGITGVREQKTAMIPTRPGTLTLPAIDVKWWNLGTNSEEIARLPARTVVVAPGRVNQTTGPAMSGPSLPQRTQTSSSPPASAGVSRFFALGAAGGWPWVALALGTGWILTLLLGWRRRYPAATPQARTDHPQQETRAQLEKRIKTSCLANDARATQTHLLAWAGQLWADSPPASMTSLAQRIESTGAPDPMLSEELIALDRHLYAPSSGQWQGQALWRLFSEHKPPEPSPSSNGNDALQPLYKSAG